MKATRYTAQVWIAQSLKGHSSATSRKAARTKVAGIVKRLRKDFVANSIKVRVFPSQWN